MKKNYGNFTYDKLDEIFDLDRIIKNFEPIFEGYKFNRTTGKYLLYEVSILEKDSNFYFEVHVSVDAEKGFLDFEANIPMLGMWGTAKYDEDSPVEMANYAVAEILRDELEEWAIDYIKDEVNFNSPKIKKILQLKENKYREGFITLKEKRNFDFGRFTYQELDDIYELSDIEKKFKPYGAKIDEDSDGWSVLVKDKNSNLTFWVDFWMSGGDLDMDWNQFTFDRYDAKDMITKYLMEVKGEEILYEAESYLMDHVDIDFE